MQTISKNDVWNSKDIKGRRLEVIETKDDRAYVHVIQNETLLEKDWVTLSFIINNYHK